MSTFAQQISTMSPLQLAYAAKEMRQKARLIDAEPIAIIGLGCRFPGADSPAAFWHLLQASQDAIGDVPPDRWNIDAYYDADPNAVGKMYTRQGGFVAQSPYDVDNEFFGISPREAASLDPQQRLLLEVSWEALEDAALPAERLAGSATGVFIGICSSDYYQRLVARGVEQIDHYLGTGNSASVAAGRLSYFFGLQGPSLAVDTACSSSLVTVHLACQSLRRGECDVALAGGVNRILSPELSINFARARMLAPDARCKTFDAAADGYVRGEGCGMVVLKRLSDARADGDTILALIRGSAINQDGRTSGLTVPNGPAQQAVIRQALDNSGIFPAQVSYVEAHGTGTALGDPIEVGALGEVFKQRSQPLLIGSVKTNVGHLEGAAGIAGLIKVALALHHGEIPSHLYCQTPTPRVAWEQYPLQVASQPHAWPAGQKFAGVSSFGFSGTNAHVVLQEAPAKKATTTVNAAPLHLLTLSAKSAEALEDLIARYECYLSTTQTHWADICATSQTGRSHFAHRLALIAESSQEAQAKLYALRAGEPVVGVVKGHVAANSQVAFLFTGQGSQYVDMGRALYETHPLFRQTLDRCDEILRPLLGESILAVIYPDKAPDGNDQSKIQNRVPGGESKIDQTAYTQPALFALEYALAQVWQSWGIEPAAVMGHSVGELVAACLAGVFSLEDGLRLIAERGRLMQHQPAGGEMVAVFASEAVCAAAIASLADQISIAASNGPQNTVLSGTQQAIQQAIDTLTRQGIESKRLTVSHAFHSPLMEPILSDFRRVARRLNYTTPQLDLVSNVTGQLASEEIMTAEYWARHIRQPVRFADGISTLQQMGMNIFIEIGPKPVLLGMGRALLAEASEARWLPSLRPQAEWQQMLTTLAELYVCGAKIDWAGVNGGNAAQRCGGLPTYAWQRQRHGVLPVETDQTSTAAPLPLAQANAWQDWLYEMQWRSQPRLGGLFHSLPAPCQLKHQLADQASEIEAPTHIHDTESCWLILAEPAGMGEILAERLQAHGHKAFLAYHDDSYAQLNDTAFHLSADLSDFHRLVANIPNITGVIHCWSLATTALDGNSLEMASRTGVGVALHILQALKATGVEVLLGGLWLVTRGVQAVDAPPQAAGVAQAPLWGLGKVIALETPALWGGMIDLPTASSPAEDAATLLYEILNPSDEDHIAFRHNERYVARLLRMPVEESIAQAGTWSITGEGSYLITGGLGKLGLKMASFLADKGAKHLILLSRRVPQGAVLAQLAQVEARGVHLHLVQGDVADEDQMRAVLENPTWPPLRGIVHCAAIASAGNETLMNMAFDSMSAALRPKVAGTWLLHHLTQHMALDFLLCFSSQAAILGSKGQGDYAAANHFLDTFAHYSRGIGRTVLSVNLGLWDIAGHETLGSNFEQGLRRIGMQPLPDEQVFAAFNYLFTSQKAQATLTAIHWPTYKPIYEAKGRRSLLEQIGLLDEGAITTEKHSLSDAISFRQQLENAPLPERQAILISQLQQQVAQVLGFAAGHAQLPAPHLGLFEMGMDSLTAVELRNRLERLVGAPLRATLAFDFPTITHLAEHLAQDVLGWLQPTPILPKTLPNSLSPTTEVRAEIAALSDEDVEEALTEGLAELESLLGI